MTRFRADGFRHSSPLTVSTCHLPVGITVGEIGPKLGQNTLNNGYLLFDHVKVPRENMLMRNARVQEVSTGGRQQRPAGQTFRRVEH